MKRLVCSSFGTEGGVAVETAPEPEFGPGEVLVGVKAANVAFVDRLIVRGGYQIKPPLPFTPGVVAAGVVIADLPRQPTGKLYKRLLKDEYWAAAGRSI